VQIRLHRGVLYNSIYRADDQLLVSQHAYGIADQRAPVLHLRSAVGGDLVTAYADARGDLRSDGDAVGLWFLITLFSVQLHVAQPLDAARRFGWPSPERTRRFRPHA
jgi:hypothetical protein